MMVEENSVREDDRVALLEEFKEAGHLHRLHITLMFGQITVFLGASGGLLYRLTNAPAIEPPLDRVLAIFGCFLGFLFLILHERVYAYSHGARRRAEEIQPILGLSLYGYCATHVRWLSALRAAPLTRILYLGAALFWLYVAIVGLSALSAQSGLPEPSAPQSKEAPSTDANWREVAR